MIVNNRIELNEKEYESLLPYAKTLRASDSNFPSNRTKERLKLIYKQLFNEEACGGCSNHWIKRLKGVFNEYEQRRIRISKASGK